MSLSRYEIILSIILVSCCLLMVNSTTHALTMSNSNWVLQMGNLNSFAGKPTNSNFKLGVTGGQIGAGLYSGTNFKVRSGFQYISSIIRLRFSISSLLIDFGSLTATNPVTRTNNLTVTNGSGYGYSVTAYENHQLLRPDTGSLIPNTTCDSGTCTNTTSAAWTSTLTYGFGYRCDNISGTDCASGFTTATFYKQFSDYSAGQTPQSVMSGSTVGKNRQSQITYKVNVSGTQPSGIYTNQIIFIATPTY